MMSDDSGISVITISAKHIAIILIIAAVGIASVISYQTMNQASDGATTVESVELANAHVWIRNNLTEAAITVLNSGDSVIRIRRIVVGGMDCDWNYVYYWKSDAGPISGELQPTDSALTGTSYNILIEAVARIFQQANSELVLESQWAIALYVKDPANISATNVPSNVTITIFTENHLYYKPAAIDVDLTIGFMGSSSITITDVSFQGTSGQSNYINITMKNTGTKVVTISQVKVNNVAKTIVGTLTLQPGDVGRVIKITMSAPGYWTNGNPYKIDLFDSSGSAVGSTQQNSPGS